MLRFILLLACFSYAFSAASFRIVKGQEGEIRKFPYLAALLHRNVVRCGSAIINKRTIITATHCFKDVILEKLSVRVGSEYGDLYLKEEGQVVPVLRYLTHPNYVALTQNNDIAIVWTKEDLEFGPNVKPIPLAASNAPLPFGEVGIASGWGRLSTKGPFPDKFHFALLPILQTNKCIKKGGGGYEAFRITNKMFCAGYLAGGMDTCKSDSGGPFVVDNTLVGIVSFGEGCGKPKFPGVYANVGAFRDWIDDQLVLERGQLLDATEKEQQKYLLKIKKGRKKLKRRI